MEDRPTGSATKWAFQIFSNSVHFSGIGLTRRRLYRRGPSKKSANLSFAQGAGWSKSRAARRTRRRCLWGVYRVGSLFYYGNSLPPAFSSRQQMSTTGGLSVQARERTEQKRG